MGPLHGTRVIEIAGIGPAPFAAMILADLGADVVRVSRGSGGLFPSGNPTDFLNRGKRSMVVDLKQSAGRDTVLRMTLGADALLEGFRPGVMERLGLGPDVVLARNSKLVYGRMTGWGQDGPMAQEAGHDINYISLAGALHAMGRKGEKPAIPLNLVGDFGGGGLVLAMGVLAALYEARGSGEGQVVDAAMVDGTAMLMASVFGANRLGFWSDERGTNLLDSGAHFYEVYETQEGRWISVGAIEPKFYASLIARLGLGDEELPDQNDSGHWPEMKRRFEAIFKSKTRDDWCAIFEGSDACVAPVLSLEEAHLHPHNVARGTFVDTNGAIQPRPAPRFSRTSTEIASGPAEDDAHTDEILAEAGFSSDEIATLRRDDAIR